MKNIVKFLSVFLIILFIPFAVFAESSAKVYADSFEVSYTEPFLIPINIKNNNGIMGFKFTLEFPSEYIEITNISKGSVTSSGNFDSNEGLRDGKADIIWNSVSDVKKDGSLFVLSVNIKSALEKDVEIKLSYSTEDTFNENWEDVALECENIKIKANKGTGTSSTAAATQKTTTADSSNQNTTAKSNTSKVTTATTLANKSNTTTQEKNIASSQVVDALEITMQQNEIKSLDEIKETDKFISDFNENLETITGTDENNISNIDELKTLYYDSYVETVTNEIMGTVDDASIKTAIENGLESVNAKSIKKIPDNKKADFVAAVEKELKKSNDEIHDFSNDVPTDTAIEIIKGIENSANNSKENKNSNVPVYISVCCVAVVIILAAIIYFIKKRKRKNAKNIEEY